ncbi:hypothetical protein CBR_g31027 [Chara braunii]|uniref:Sulfhydryl oxidase n=1 Tax=Chara braunii TaxID=69332 RepID=A0A388LE75_CHABU|nr:hypothetical protein CBR_g31027 [Chara braunii]|eukprot:GBG80567.1 hypothetical protein CBR_g31027 [Chara braunii]
MQEQLDGILRRWEDRAQGLSKKWEFVRGAALQIVAGFVDGQLSRVRDFTKVGGEVPYNQVNQGGGDVGAKEATSSSSYAANEVPISSEEHGSFSGRLLQLAGLTLLSSRLSDAVRDVHGMQQTSEAAGSSPSSRSSEPSVKSLSEGNAEATAPEGGQGGKVQTGEKQGVLDRSGAMRQGYGGAVSLAELGRCTWVFLHTLATQFPENPTKQQQRDAKELMMILTRIYPCKECAEHLTTVIEANPPKTSSGSEFSQWMCQIHNSVNRSIGKPEFPCRRVDMRWGSMNCEGNVCNLKGRPFRPK